MLVYLLTNLKKVILMKKVTSIAMIALFAASFTACKKDWTCECSVDGEVFATSTINDTKKNAKDQCEGEVSSFGTTVKCEIK